MSPYLLRDLRGVPTRFSGDAARVQLSLNSAARVCLSSPCLLHSFFEPALPAAGGDDGIRTHDPLLAGQVLSQLSYTPA